MTPLPPLDLSDRKAAGKLYDSWWDKNCAAFDSGQLIAARLVNLAFDECDMNRNNPPALRSAIDSLEQRIAKLRELLA